MATARDLGEYLLWHDRTMAFDALGRLVETTNPDGGIERVSYNKRDQQLSFKDGIDVTTSFTSNGFGEVI